MMGKAISSVITNNKTLNGGLRDYSSLYFDHQVRSVCQNNDALELQLLGSDVE
jgi:hypothetical protein